jgi:hypothetical protein
MAPNLLPIRRLAQSIHDQTRSRRRNVAVTVLLGTLSMMAVASPASAQVRTKLPDRDSYQSPQIKSTTLRSVMVEDLRDGANASGADSPWANDAPQQRSAEPNLPASGVAQSRAPSTVRPVAHDDVILVQPKSNIVSSDTIIHGDGVIFDEPMNISQPYYHDGSPIAGNLHGSSCDGCGSCDGGCDGIGCNSGCGISGCGCGGGLGLGRSAISFCRDQWFGGVDLMLMFRNGDRLPPLVTTGPATNIETAGALDQNATRILAGDEKVFDDGTVGGRLTLGTWLDESHCRSLVFRGWIAAEDTYGFNADQDDGVLTRPFFNVSSLPNDDDTLVVAFPGEATGAIHVRGSSNVFGGDLSVRQLWYGRFGGTLDVLYGYQYMRLDEDLRIRSTSLSGGGNLAPAGSVSTVVDSFEAVNEFHGGQFGVVSNYREGCWSFRGLAKVGMGSLRRSATRRGSRTTELGADSAFDPNGLLVRSTNRGVDNDSTFGWIPELDVSLGWHHFPNFDVTIGYHIIAMTDALQVSGMIDPNLASNVSDPLVGTPAPSPSLRFDTFYIHGIHLGLQYVY